MPVVGDKAVHTITHGARNNAQPCGHRPRAVKVPRQAQGTFGPYVGMAIIDQHQGVDGTRVDAVGPRKRPTGIGLQRGKPNLGRSLVLQNKLHKAIAQIALTVKQQDGAAGRQRVAHC